MQQRHFSSAILFASRSPSQPFSSFPFPSLFWLISKYVELNPLLFVAKTIFSTVTVTKYLSYQMLKNKFLKQKSSLTRRQWSHHFLRDFRPRKNAGCTNSSHDFWQRKYNILLPPDGRTPDFLPSHPKSARKDRVRWRHNHIFSDG